MKKGYNYYAHQVFDQAVHAPHVDENSTVEVVEYAEEIALLLSLDPDRLKSETRQLAHMQSMSQF